MERGDRLSVLLVVQTERQRETFRQILQLTETGVLFGVRVRIVVGARSKVQERIAQRFRHRLCAQNLVDLSQFAQGELDNVAVVVEELCGRGAIERLEELSRMIEIRISWRRWTTQKFTKNPYIPLHNFWLHRLMLASEWCCRRSVYSSRLGSCVSCAASPDVDCSAPPRRKCSPLWTPSPGWKARVPVWDFDLAGTRAELDSSSPVWPRIRLEDRTEWSRPVGESRVISD